MLQQERKEDEMYTCRCCKSLLSRKEFPPVNNLCPECRKSNEATLISLYNDVERVLSHALQAETANLIDHIRRARDNLRNIMIKMGWEGPF